MKTVILIGANGKMGKAALTGLGKHKVITAGRSKDGCDYQVDITSEESLRKLFKEVGHFDAVVNTVGVCEYATFKEMTEAQWMTTVMSKMMGQINIVRIGQEYIADKGSFTLITGILNLKPIPFAIADATTSGAIDTFVKCVAFEMPRGIRVNSVNPAVGDKCDFVSRFFTPQASILEDPVTGSAHCSLIPFWSKRLNKKELYAKQVSERLGKLYCEDKEDRVIISGQAKTYSIGKFWTE